MEWYEIAFGVGGGIAGWVLISDTARTRWGRTFGRRRAACRKVERLSTSVTEEWFRSILGPPAMARSDGGVTEKIWVDPIFYVQAVVDSADQVVQWAVTSRDLEFRPVFGGEHRRPFKVQLHVTPFSELGRATGVDAVHGARRCGYREEHYWGNPGAYQNFVFAVTDAAPSIADKDLYAIVSAVNPFEGEPLVLAEILELPERARVAPNTYGETAPNGSWSASFPPGVDLDHVRVVP
jgi:hypothetical protein